jgi:hypothetical protein
MIKHAVNTIAVLMLGLSGCLPVRPVVEPNSTLDLNALASALVPGNSTISGEAFVTTESGSRRQAIHEMVTLLPAEPYVLECARIVLTANSNCAQLLAPYEQTTKTDSEGRFVFTRLRQGSYHLSVEINWEVSRGKLGMQHLRRTAQAYVLIEEEGQAAKAVFNEAR